MEVDKLTDIQLTKIIMEQYETLITTQNNLHYLRQELQKRENQTCENSKK